MEKAAVIERIDEDLGRLPEVKRACLAIVEYLSVEREHVKRVTFRQLGRIAGLDKIADVLPAVEYLSGGRVHLLDPRFEFIDARDDFIEEIPIDQVARARAEAVFYHPRTGEPVDNFENYLFMFFVLSDDARSLGRAS